jgi:hypothetical protein
MIKQLENEIRDLKRKLAEIQKEQAVLRLQSCRGDSEIRGKDAKSYELDGRAKVINETIRGMTRKRQLLGEGDVDSNATFQENERRRSTKLSNLLLGTSAMAMARRGGEKEVVGYIG